MSYSNAYSNAYIWNLEKMVLKNLFTGQQWRKRHREQAYRYGEKGGEGEMYGKSSMEITLQIGRAHV